MINLCYLVLKTIPLTKTEEDLLFFYHFRITLTMRNLFKLILKTIPFD